MARSFSEVRAVVTGAASGLGRAVAARIVEAGGEVALLDADRGRGEQAAQELGSSAVYLHCDVTSESSVREAIAGAVQRFEYIDLAVNCAGISSVGRVVGRDALLPVDAFRRVMEVNLYGTFLVCRAAAAAIQSNTPTGEDGERGVLVNTASISAYEGQVGQVAYAASKGGVASMTLPLAREFAVIGVRVLAIAPGVFATPMFEQLPAGQRDGLLEALPFPKRPGHAAEFAALVAHIFENPMLNGAVLRLDGALRMPAKGRSGT